MNTRIGIVGAGKIAREQHIPAIAANSDFSLAAIADPHARVDDVANFPGIEAMLDGCELDAVAICTPPQLHYEAAKLALSRGKHLLLEKPPCTTLLELDDLQQIAAASGRTFYQAWHSQHARGVAPAMRLLAERKLKSIRITWKEDVRHWHPGQTWIWQAGGFGVFDPGINALSILTNLVPEAFFVRAAHLFTPSNCQAPIAAQMEFVTASGKPISAAFDFRHTGVQTWDIEIETDGGPLRLSAGGGILTVGNREIPPDPGALDSEYHSIYRDFAALIARRACEVDARPLQLVADIFLTARQTPVEPFVE